MSARRHGRRRVTSSSGRLGRTGSPISSLFGTDAMLPSSSASWLGLSRSAESWWRSSVLTPLSSPATTTTSASTYGSVDQAAYNKLLSDIYQSELWRLTNTPSPLYSLDLETPGLALDEDDGA